MDFLYILSRLASGLIIGFAIGLTGIGGGVLVIPALAILYRLSPTTAVGTASLYALFTKLFAAFEHFRLKTINLGVSLWFLLGAIPANLVSSLFVVNFIDQHNREAIQAFQGNLKLVIGLVLLAAVLVLFISLFRKDKGNDNAGIRLTPVKTVIIILAGLAIGALIGLTSIGGGVLIIPLLAALGMRTKRVVGTSIFIALILVIITSLIYSLGGQIDTLTAVIMSFGSLLGVFLGSHLSVRLPEKQLKAIVTAIVFVATIMMFID